jgi:hypothetical protein
MRFALAVAVIDGAFLGGALVRGDVVAVAGFCLIVVAALVLKPWRDG